MEKSLLDELASQLECVYLSDLHRADRRKLLRWLRNVSAEAYSLWEWEDAARYLIGNGVHGSSQTEVKEALMDALDEPAG